jgi:hypothetical protein
MKKRLTPRRDLEVLICNGRLQLLGVLALVCFLAMTSQPASAQVAFGSMVGNVTDATNAGIVGASVKSH